MKLIINKKGIYPNPLNDFNVWTKRILFFNINYIIHRQCFNNQTNLLRANHVCCKSILWRNIVQLWLKRLKLTDIPSFYFIFFRCQYQNNSYKQIGGKKKKHISIFTIYQKKIKYSYSQQKGSPTRQEIFKGQISRMSFKDIDNIIKKKEKANRVWKLRGMCPTVTVHLLIWRLLSIVIKFGLTRSLFSY